MGVQILGTYGNPHHDLITDEGFLVAHGTLDDEGNFNVDLDNLPPGVWVVDEEEYELESPEYKFAKNLGMDVSYDANTKSYKKNLDIIHADLSEISVTEDKISIPDTAIDTPKLHIVPSAC